MDADKKETVQETEEESVVTEAAEEVVEEAAAEEVVEEVVVDEMAILNDKYLRVCAEYDNFRRRSQKEREALYGDVRCDVVTKFLPVYDNLERARRKRYFSLI